MSFQFFPFAVVLNESPMKL